MKYLATTLAPSLAMGTLIATALFVGCSSPDADQVRSVGSRLTTDGGVPIDPSTPPIIIEEGDPVDLDGGFIDGGFTPLPPRDGGFTPLPPRDAGPVDPNQQGGDDGGVTPIPQPEPFCACLIQPGDIPDGPDHCLLQNRPQPNLELACRNAPGCQVRHLDPRGIDWVYDMRPCGMVTPGPPPPPVQECTCPVGYGEHKGSYDDCARPENGGAGMCLQATCEVFSNSGISSIRPCVHFADFTPLPPPPPLPPGLLCACPTDEHVIIDDCPQITSLVCEFASCVTWDPATPSEPPISHPCEIVSVPFN